MIFQVPMIILCPSSKCRTMVSAAKPWVRAEHRQGILHVLSSTFSFRAAQWLGLMFSFDRLSAPVLSAVAQIWSAAAFTRIKQSAAAWDMCNLIALHSVSGYRRRFKVAIQLTAACGGQAWSAHTTLLSYRGVRVVDPNQHLSENTSVKPGLSCNWTGHRKE